MKRKTTKGSNQQPVAQVEAVNLDADAATSLELAHLKAESASNAAAARKAELENLVLQVRARYEESGKYTVLQIDANTKKVHRVLTASLPKESATFREQTGTPSSEGDQSQG